MNKLTITLTSLLASFALLGCNEEEKSPGSQDTSAPAATPAANAAAPAANAAAPAADAATPAAGATAEKSAPAKKPGEVSKLVGDAESMLNENPQSESGLSQVSKISGFSDTLNSTWNSIKGMDYAQKATFLKQASDLVSSAKKHIGMLKQIAPMITGGSSGALIEQISGLTSQVGGLSSLVSKGQGIASGDWGSYKDQIGSAIKGLSGGFSGLSSLVK